ncbi:MAG: hypothetical protein PHV93_01840 [Candidatus Pacebacteria bacterium]|nr:hypothetical protein [Candidatus Paceibacterota bacterium]
MEPTTNSSSRNMIIGIVVVIVVLALGTYLFTRNSTPATPEASPTPTDAMVSAGGDKLAVGAQFPGSTLYLDSVTFAKGGWVAVHEDNAGVPGKVIGSKYFPAGTNPGSIDLGNNKMVEGKDYIVMLHSDDGDGKFDEVKDAPIRDTSGNIIMLTVRASKTPEEVKG